MATRVAPAPCGRVVERRRAVALARHFREAEGLSIDQIAQRRGRSPATIKAYFYDPTGERLELSGKATSHRRFRHESGVVITVPGHGRQDLSQKHLGMIVRQLEAMGFNRDAVRRDLNAR